MYINITDSETGDNKGSSGTLVHYLDKENRLFKMDEPLPWFNDTNRNIQSYEVKSKLDNNVAKLCRDDAKFFLVNINPSQKEIAHLKQKYGEDGAKQQLMAYAVKVMDEYAKNFKRSDIQSNTDLLWFGKLENHRYYSHKDKEVKNGQVKRGTVKAGEQMHIQVIVSRKDITNKIRLSPMNKSRGKNAEHSKKLGQFDRSAFKNSGEHLFDKTFHFQRPKTETFEHARTNAKASLKERLEQSAKPKKYGENKEQIAQKELKQEMPTTYLAQPAETSYLEMLLEKQGFDPIESGLKKKRRRKKGKEQNNEQGLGL